MTDPTIRRRARRAQLGIAALPVVAAPNSLHGVASKGKKTRGGNEPPRNVKNEGTSGDVHENKWQVTIWPPQKTSFMPSSTPFCAETHVFCGNRRRFCRNILESWASWEALGMMQQLGVDVLQSAGSGLW